MPALFNGEVYTLKHLVVASNLKPDPLELDRIGQTPLIPAHRLPPGPEAGYPALLDADASGYSLLDKRIDTVKAF